jgi:hypothetical protein
MLIEVCSKIFSSVMNGRAFHLLELHGTKFQVGGIPTLGCRDGLLTLKTLLNAHKNHNLPSFVAFVDLVKTYDTANNDLLIKILKKYGANPKFVAAVQTMYTNLKVVLKIETEVCEILQSVGVQQGDNMAPVIFLFLMSATAETLELEWKRLELRCLLLHTHLTTRSILGASKDTPRKCTPRANLLRMKSSSYSTSMTEHSPSQLALHSLMDWLSSTATLHNLAWKYTLVETVNHLKLNVYSSPPPNSSPTTRTAHPRPSPTTKMNPCSPPLPQVEHYASQNCKNLSKLTLQERTPNMTHSQRQRRLT